MEPNESSGLSSYYHHQPTPPQASPPPQQHLHQQTPAITPTVAANPNTTPTNGILLNPSETGPHSVYPHSVPSAISSPLETVRRRRGRPRKYETPEQAAAAKKLSSSISAPRKEQSSRGAAGAGAGASLSSFASTSSSKKSQLTSLGSTGQSFTPHIISVAAGEDVGQKIMVFIQRSKCELCILSASGSISNASLLQPATSGGSITYEGLFDILSLSGSYVRTSLGGRTGGMSICLSSSDGQIIGGGVGGPLTAAGPVQVIVGIFTLDSKKDMGAGVKGDASGIKLGSSIGGAPFSGVDFHSMVDHHDVGSQLIPPSWHAGDMD